VSVQFGRWNFDSKPVDRNYLEKVTPVIAPYGPDGGGSYSKGNISILYHAFHTTKESRREEQPHVMASGAVITWDGRLDNRAELIRKLRDVLTINSTDLSIVAAAYEQWGTDCFAMLIGDWALSVWNPSTRSLILAKDPIGTRHLYYSLDKDQVTWSTILDPLVLFAGKIFALEEEYIAGWFSFFPAAHLTPYVGIHSVPPCSSVLIRAGKQTVRKYWDFDPSKKIRYRTDAEYEEHFRTVFAEAVRRRLRSDRPVLAELSGGMDSSSIVCMADTVIARGAAETSRLDTVSYYDDSEPNWNERPYFTKVEEKRGRTGCHIDVGLQESFKFESERFAATPGAGGRRSRAATQYAQCLTSQANRVVLSGIGGDEVTGGVPTPTPELADLLARAQFRTLTHQLKVWALNKRTPWFQLFFETLRGFLPPAVTGVPQHKRPPSWLQPDFVKRNRAALEGYQARLKVFGPLPSFQSNVATLEGLRRQLACSQRPSEPAFDKRYPYLDHDFLAFLFSIPRNQLVGPNDRRSLMRRSLVGIVPNEILCRRRKAFVARGPLLAISSERATLLVQCDHMISADLKIVDTNAFGQILKDTRCDQEIPFVPLARTLSIEGWLRSLDQLELLSQGCDGLRPKDFRVPISGKCPQIHGQTALSAEENSTQKGGETHAI
jgi:asparagine synthase (glutamine-hydrolysing)